MGAITELGSSLSVLSLESRTDLRCFLPRDTHLAIDTPAVGTSIVAPTLNVGRLVRSLVLVLASRMVCRGSSDTQIPLKIDLK